MEAFPVVEEAAPDFEDINISGEDLAGAAWPLPSTKFVNSDGTQSIILQEGRLDLSWEKADAPYPGFESLSKTLLGKFNELEKAMEDAGISIRPTASRCLYVNEIADITGAQLATGVLTDWSSEPRQDLPSKGYVGVRIHACANPANHRCSSYVMVDGDMGQSPNLTLSVKRRLEDTEHSPLGGLHEAHNELLDLFMTFTSDNQQADWGRSG
ncbi:hypothetical protein [Barrientosiimonas endolithica]|uniref:Uncharacterized protein n=1 Tax=Barrientosiimonas endolithica TaxID=1535208 RepID=A0ABN6YI20_9MICO|nr:hypothetical protein [Barrientosiimonas endolithica]BDZ56604.1 hypothetical protein GCM10025872_02610 [Barrientosiimonas endolithica]